MKAIIIDDDKRAIDDLADKLKECSDVELMATTSDASFGLKMLKTEIPDLLFLDVEMPEMSGIDFLKEMERMNIWCHVIVTTSYSIHMLPAFRHDAFDFLTKPIDVAELKTAIERVRKDLDSPRRTTVADEGQAKSGFLLCYTNTEDFQLVNVSNIGLFRYNGDVRSWEVVIANQKLPVKLKRDVTNKDLLALDSRFIQVSQKFIVNINCLLKVRDNICVFNPPFESIDYVKVGRLYRKRLVDRFLSF
ncbi:MAG TPA: hypothetical protein DEQ27_07480 [Prevotella sp.]|nr:hypothetical protein [Prevotella sp.]